MTEAGHCAESVVVACNAASIDAIQRMLKFTQTSVRRPNEMQISCKRPEENLRSLARHRSGADHGARPLRACRLHLRVRRRPRAELFLFQQALSIRNSATDLSVLWLAVRLTHYSIATVNAANAAALTA